MYTFLHFRFIAAFAHTEFYHLFSNLYSLKNVGSAVESIFGPNRLLITYLFSGIFSNILTFLTDVSPLSLGASGAVFGLVGAIVVFYARNSAVLGNNSKQGMIVS